MRTAIRNTLFSLFISFTLLSMISADDSGVAKLKLGKDFTNKVLKLAVSNAFEEVNKQIDTLTQYSWAYSFLVSFEFTKLKIDHLNFDENKIQIGYVKNTNDIQLLIKGFDINVDSDLKNKFLFLPTSNGHLKAKLNVNLNINLKFSQDKNQRLSIALDTFSFDYNGTDIDLTGGFLLWSLEVTERMWRWMNNLIINYVVKGYVKQAVTALDNNLRSKISVLGVDAQISTYSPPKVDTEYLDLELKVDFTSTPKRLFSSSIADLAQKYRMMKLKGDVDSEEAVLMFDYQLLNQFSSNLAKVGFFSRSFNSTDIPPEVPIKLNTKYFENMIPGLYELYPNQDFIVSLSSVDNKAPKMTFNEEKQLIDAEGDFIFSFQMVSNPSTVVFSFTTTIQFSILVGAETHDAILHIQIGRLEITEMKIIVDIKDVDIDKLKTQFNFLFQSVTYALNKYYLNNGFPFDFVKGLKFKEVNVKIIDSSYFRINFLPDYSTTKFTWMKAINDK